MNDGNIDLFEAIYTTRAIRRFKTDPVPDALLRRVLEAGGQAPSGGNRQPWRFFVIRRPEAREELRTLLGQAAANSGADSAAIQAFADAPVVIIVCATRGTVTGAGSVGPFGQTYPVVENILLAARAVGLGSCITTSFREANDAIREWLQLPENLETTCLMPLGYPLGTKDQRHGKKTRSPIEELTFEEKMGNHIALS